MKIKKFISKILATSICITTMCSLLTMNVLAEDKEYDLDVTTEYAAKAEVPLTIEASKSMFYINKNINPGDILEADIVFKNTSEKEPLKVTISDIINLLGDDDDALKLLGQLELTITVDGKIIYKGPHDKTTKPVIGWIQVPPGEEIEIHIEIYFPKESDNSYQNLPLKVRYEFQSQIDIPGDWGEETVEYSETIKTGEEPEEGMNYTTLIIALGMLAIGVYLITYIVLAKKKKEKNK